MRVWRHEWPMAVACLLILALVALRLAALASAAGPATRDAQLTIFGTTDASNLPAPTGNR